MKQQKFNSAEALLNAGDFSHLNQDDLKATEYDFFVWYEDGTIYGSKNNSMHFITDDCGEPEYEN